MERSSVLLNERSASGHGAALGAVAITLAAAVFYVDAFTKIEGAIAVLYVIILLLLSEILTRFGVLLAAAGCFALAFLSYLLTHGPDADLQNFVRLTVSLAALAITTVLLLRNETFRTALIEKNAAVRESEARFRSIFDKTRVALWECDYSQVQSFLLGLKADGVADLKAYASAHPEIVDHCIGLVATVAANDAACELLGSSGGDKAAGSIGRFIASGDETFLAIMEAIFLEQTYFEGKGKVLTENGETKQVLLSISFPEYTSSFNRVIVGMVDITQRELTQMALVQAQAELTKASRAATVGALSASLAHELNQPLGAIVVNARTLIRWLDRDPPDLAAARRTVERMVRDGQRASEIIKNTRNMLSQSEATTEQIDLRTLIDETRALMEHDLQRHSINIRVVSAEVVPSVKAVKIEIQQVIINLMTNAIQAMSGADSDVRWISVGIQHAGREKVMLSIRDSGPGISDEAMGKLFTPFFTTKASGMGVGLSICRSTLEGRGGSLEGYNHPQGGAVFDMTLPIDDAHG